MSVSESVLSYYRQNEIRRLVTAIRRQRGVGNRNNHNLVFTSANRSINRNLAVNLTQILNHIASAYTGNAIQFQHARLLIRYRSNIPSQYVSQQTLHYNIIATPQEGEAVLQFIYYIDTPQINGRGNAPVNERGSILLVPPRGNSRIITPRAGQVVFFPPNLVAHEVIPPRGNVPGAVSRNMIIGFVFRQPTANTRFMNTQVRPSESYARAVRAVAGIQPRNTNTGRTASGINNLSGVFSRGLNLGGLRRMNVNNNNNAMNTRPN